VDFDLSPEERLLKASVGDLAASCFGSERSARLVEVDWRTPWKLMTEMGLTGLLVPEDHGGSGGSLVDACIVAEELAKANAWVPFVGSAVISVVGLNLCAGDGEALERAAQGEVFSTLLDDRLIWSDRPANRAFDWRDGATALVLSGDCLSRAEVRTPSSIDATDFAHPLGRFADVPVNAPAWTPQQRTTRASGWVVLAAWLTGLAEAALADAVEYACIREQFDVPIGSFQAIQHICADMHVKVETSRSVAYGAAWTLANSPIDEAERVAAAAKSWCGSSAARVCEDSIQVFGGMGITWEHIAHLRLRTADQFRQVLGAPKELNGLVAAARGYSLVGS
jgi:alkylation response protein AidB-like acyl-CoA dehydrogenase